jgi:hypothetical protein
MPPVTLTRLRSRIGDLGLPRVLWLVYMSDGDEEFVGFYDRDKADAYAKLDHRRFVGTAPLHIKDASP